MLFQRLGMLSSSSAVQLKFLLRHDLTILGRKTGLKKTEEVKTRREEIDRQTLMIPRLSQAWKLRVLAYVILLLGQSQALSF